MLHLLENPQRLSFQTTEFCLVCIPASPTTYSYTYMLTAGVASSKCLRVTADHMVSYSHVHVIDAQLAMEMLPDIATKPDRLRERQQCEVTPGSGPEAVFPQKQESRPTSPSLMESAAAFFSTWMGWLLYNVLWPPTMLPRNSTLYSLP